jgi:hypothetical protein
MVSINPLNAELNPIHHLLALLGAHHILHVRRIRVNCEVPIMKYFPTFYCFILLCSNTLFYNALSCFILYFIFIYGLFCRSRWPRGLRLGSAAAYGLDCGFESRWDHGGLSVVSVVCCCVESSVSSWTFIQRSPTKGGVSEYDLEASKMRRPWATARCRAMKKNDLF